MKHRSRMSVMNLGIGAVSCIFFGFMMSQHFGQNWPPDFVSDRSLLDIKRNSVAVPNPTLAALEASSTTFESTLRSCLGPNCFDQDARDSNGISTDRVGLLAPLNSGGEDILLFLTKFMETPRRSKKTRIELVYETNVPAYGYGKNHGWSRIIRLTRKVCPHALSLIVGLNLDDGGAKITGRSQQEKFSATLDIQTRQLVRWQCRLNHVAAHTKLLTVFVEDLVERPAMTLEMMLTFSGCTFSRPSLLVAIPNFITHLKGILAFSVAPFLPPSSNRSNDIIEINDKTEKLLIVPKDLLEVCTSAVLDEISSSNGLTRWPCESFRNINPYGKSERMQTNEILFLREKLLMSPQMLAANCSNTFVKCSVPYDRAGG